MSHFAKLLGLCVLLAVAACTSDKPPAQTATDAGSSARDAGDFGNAPRDGGTKPAALDAAVSGNADASADAALDAAGGSSTNTDAGSVTSSACQNGLQDGTETDIDCGGGACGTCLSGRHCSAHSDCLSGECKDGACTCIPLGACPASACGVIRHCGQELDCGSCTSGVCYENQCCTPRSCKAGECGVISDGCGGTLRCGDESCCTPRTCQHPTLQDHCGDFDDRCGGSVSCTCSDASARCYLGECCVPKTCSDMSGACGSVLSDGCGGTTTCGCDSGETCHQGQCCKPLTDCSTWVGPGCGTLADGCGGSLACGCSGNQTCNAGTCCTPTTTCPAGNAGDACGAVSNGCGGTLSCGCSGGLPCMNGSCCQAQDCSAQGRDARCGPATDTCGGSLWCGCGTSNAMRVAQRAACGSACADTLAKVNTCTANAALETLDQTAGWDFGGSFNTSICAASYGFSPNWTSCHNGFQLDAQGFIYLGAGTHCFSIDGSKTNSCGALYFVSTPASFTGWADMPSSTAATVVTGNAPVCFTLASADYYPIRWHYTLSGILGDFHVNYCPGGAGNCAVLAPSMLYPALP